jgi:hypothetical protein
VERGRGGEMRGGSWCVVSWLKLRPGSEVAEGEGVGVRGCGRLLYIGSRHTTNGISLSCVETNIHDKASLPCVSAPQTFFYNFLKFIKIVK